MLQDISFISHSSPSLSNSAQTLTVDNVLTAVQGVNWRTLGEALLPEVYYDHECEDSLKYHFDAKPKLDEIRQQYQSDDDRLHAVVKTWIHGDGRDKKPSWKHLIWRLDDGNLARAADSIRLFAEPVLGKSCDSISVSTFLCSVYKSFYT